MAKVTLAVLDSCRFYLERFLDYSKSIKNSPFEILGYYDLNILLKKLEDEKIEAVLFSPEIFKNSDQCELKNNLFQSGKNCVCLILGEQDSADIFNEKYANLLHGKKLSCINKFQPVDEILMQLQEILNINSYEKEREISSIKNQYELIGLYSPIAKGSHIKEAVAIAQSEKYRDKKTLYINFDQFSGIDEWMDYPKNTDMTDVIFYFKTNPSKLGLALNKAKGQLRGMDCLSSPVDFTDLSELDEKAWPEFLSLLSSAGGYDIIILDILVVLLNFLKILDRCGRLIIPALPQDPDTDVRKMLRMTDKIENRVRKRKFEEFKKYLRDKDLHRLAETMQELKAGE